MIKRMIICLFVAGLGSSAFAQKIEREIERQFDSYRKTTLQEKMYVHTDKDFYLAGEICWFKIYTVDAFFHKPLDVSKIGYIELLDNAHKPFLQAKVSLSGGLGNGAVFIPVTIPSGNYTIRAYSNWMKNFSAGFYFEKMIRIVNTQVVTELPAKQRGNGFDIQFFPEGGNLVNGLQSKVAYKVVDQNGKGVDCRGVILNNNKDTLLAIQPLQFGLGHFDITPIAGGHYTALFLMPNGQKVSKELPQVYNNGFVMHLAEEGENQLKITVRFVADEREPAPLSVYLFVHTRSSIKTASSALFQNGTATFLVDKQKLGEGVSHFTIFDYNRHPVCERLYFKPPTQKLSIKITTDQPGYQLRQKVNLQMNAMAPGGKPAATDMSMAVYRLDSLQGFLENGICEYLWLTADLPGNIESPEYYFNTTGAAAAEAVDNLMLTNGWRRFKWEEVMEHKKPVFTFAPEYNGHIITGKVVDNLTGNPKADVVAYLSAPGTTSFRTDVSDQKGNIKFEMQHFYGTPGIVVETNTEKDSTCHVEIDNPFSLDYAAKTLPAFTMPVQNANTLLDQHINMQVENIYNGDSRKKMDITVMDTIGFYGHPNELYLLDNYVRFTTMEEVLREYVLSVNVRRKGNRFHLPMFNDDIASGPFDADPLVLLDGVPVFNMDKIMQYDPLKVRKLEAVTRRYFYGKTIYDGIVSMVTYNGNLEGFELDPHATILDYEALQLQREFYSPVYATTQEQASHLPDFRNVLNWLPAIKTGKDGKYNHSFYTSDIPGKYIVVVQALTPDGIAGSGHYFFEVKKAGTIK